jgi:hypothetical protein
MSVLFVSVFPRGAPWGESALAALDPATHEVRAYREFPVHEFLADPARGEATSVRHARGLAVDGDRLFVSLFNSVGEYRVEDAARLQLTLERRLTSPAAADLHGISLAGRTLAGASTGGDCVVSWDLETEVWRSIGIDGARAPRKDIRFPDGAAGGPEASWRRALAPQGHVNNVSLTATGAIVCSLTKIVALASSTPQTVLKSDPAALFHDAQIIGGRLVATDGARGELMLLELDSGTETRVPVADPAAWFVRGIRMIGGHSYVLRSQVTRNRQTSLRERRPVLSRGTAFGLSIVDLDAGVILADDVIDLPDAPAGATVYEPAIIETESPLTHAAAASAGRLAV